jgi:hypothetical protein
MKMACIWPDGLGLLVRRGGKYALFLAGLKHIFCAPVSR